MLHSKKKNLIFISIGAGFHQLPLIEEAKKLGFYIIGVDIDTSAAGLLNCDIRIQESIKEHDEIYKKLEELMLDKKIVGILSKSHGDAIKTACFIANKLNIPMIPYKRIDDFNNKVKMKKLFIKKNIPSPDYKLIKNMQDIEKIKRSHYPLVAKPVTGHAKINVQLVNNRNDVENYWFNNIKKTSFITEKYTKGDEIIAAGIVYKKKYHLVDLSDKIKTAPPYFVDLMHISPSKYFHLQNIITEIGQSISDAFEIYTSPLIIELIVPDENNIQVIEAVPEFGGEYIPEIIIPSRTKYNFISETIRAVSGMKFTQPSLKKRKQVVAAKFITSKEGNLQSFHPDKPNKIKGVIFSRIFKEIGAQINTPMSNHDRLGVVIVKAQNREDAIKIADKAADSFDIIIK